LVYLYSSIHLSLNERGDNKNVLYKQQGTADRKTSMIRPRTVTSDRFGSF